MEASPTTPTSSESSSRRRFASRINGRSVLLFLIGLTATPFAITGMFRLMPDGYGSTRGIGALLWEASLFLPFGLAAVTGAALARFSSRWRAAGAGVIAATVAFAMLLGWILLSWSRFPMD